MTNPITFGNRAKETSTTTGTGTYSLAGAVTGYQTLVAAAAAHAGGAGPWRVEYLATDGTDWESGIGTLTDDTTDTLSRDTILESSNSGSAVSWGTGTRTIILTPSARSIAGGKQAIWVPAAAMRPATTNGCASLADVELAGPGVQVPVLDFDSTTMEHAHFQIAFPRAWNLGTVTYKVYWTNANANTNSVTWLLRGVAISDDDALNATFGSPVEVTDANLNAANDLMVSAESDALTIGGTPADGDMVSFMVSRDPDDSLDDLGSDARLLGIMLYFTTIGASDD